MEEKYICLEQGHIFETPKKYGFGTPGGIYNYYACPYCEGNYRKAELCSICMEYKTQETGEHFDGQFICKECSNLLEENGEL